MNRNAVAAVVLAILLLGVSITFSTDNNIVYAPFQDQIDRTQQFALSAPLVLGVSTQQQYTALNQSTRADIYTYVENNPGVHFRGLCESLGLSIGRAQYHTGILVSAGFLTVYSDGKMQRFFIRGKYSVRKMKIISLLRHSTRGDILKIICERKAVSHGELANQLDITSQGLTWQMHHLKKEGVIQQTSNGLKLSYRINETDATSIRESIGLVSS